jgi:NADPH-dependent 2,4-dienoyl-CoA reductase/sulfur reductase-like enzyme
MQGPLRVGVVIIGASVSGVHVAEQLRTRGYERPVLLLEGESVHPYDKPPLSKSLLDGGVVEDDLALISGERLAALEVDVRLDSVVTGLVRGGVQLVDGSIVLADHVVIASGSAARTLPGQPATERFLTLRTLEDARELRTRMVPGHRLVVIGAGLIGTEVAWTARRSGLDVTLVDRAALPLERVVGDLAGARLKAAHEAAGINFLMNASIANLAGDGGGAVVEFDQGPPLIADTVLVAVGAVPRSAWLPPEFLDEAGALVVDAGGRVPGRPGLYAAGDVCAVRIGTGLRRTEHWTAAREQASAVAQSILGLTRAVTSTPDYVWTDQAGMRIQILGEPRAGDREWIQVESDGDGRGAVHLSMSGDLPVGAVIFGAPRLMPKYSRLLADSTPGRTTTDEVDVVVQ